MPQLLLNKSYITFFIKNLNMFRVSSSIPTNNTFSTGKLLYGKQKLKKLLNKSFGEFMGISFFRQKTSLHVNKSFSNFFINNGCGGSAKVVSVNKYYHTYINVLKLVYNLFYYNINTLWFGNSFFKNEVNSNN